MTSLGQKPKTILEGVKKQRGKNTRCLGVSEIEQEDPYHIDTRERKIKQQKRKTKIGGKPNKT